MASDDDELVYGSDDEEPVGSSAPGLPAPAGGSDPRCNLDPSRFDDIASHWDDLSRDHTDEELEAIGSGGDVGYSTYRQSNTRDADHIWCQPVYCSGGDYANSSYVEKANYKVLVEACQALSDALNQDPDNPDVCPLPWWFTTSGGYGTFGIILHAERTPDEIAEMLEKLDDYPLLDEEVMGELEMEGQSEAWEDWARSDYKHALEKVWDELVDFDEVTHDELARHFYENADAANEYWEDDGGSQYIDVEKVAKYAFENDDLPAGATRVEGEPDSDGEPPAGAPGGYDIELNGLGATGTTALEYLPPPDCAEDKRSVWYSLFADNAAIEVRDHGAKGCTVEVYSHRDPMDHTTGFDVVGIDISNAIIDDAVAATAHAGKIQHATTDGRSWIRRRFAGAEGLKLIAQRHAYTASAFFYGTAPDLPHCKGSKGSFGPQAPDTSRGYDIALDGLRGSAQEASAGFAIAVYTEDLLEENALDRFGAKHGDPRDRADAIAAGFWDGSAEEITPAGLGQLGQDIIVLEQNSVAWLNKTFKHARADGHDAHDDLVGVVWFDASDKDQVDLIELGEQGNERIDMVDPSYGTLADMVWAGVSPFGQQILGGGIQFFDVTGLEQEDEPASVVVDTTAGYDIALDGVRGLGAATDPIAHTPDFWRQQEVIRQGHADDLVYNSDVYRVWVSRMKVADGAEEDAQVMIETRMPGDRWGAAAVSFKNQWYEYAGYHDAHGFRRGRKLEAYPAAAQAPDTSRGYDIALDGVRYVGAEVEVGFAISTSTEDEIVGTADEVFRNDPADSRKAVRQGVWDATAHAITPAGWQQINDDARQLEQATLSWLSVTFGRARSDGHDKYDDLVGSVWVDPSNAELREIIDLGGEGALLIEREWQTGLLKDLHSYAYTNVSWFGHTVLGGRIAFFGAGLEALNEEPVVAVPDTTAGYDIALDGLRGLGAALDKNSRPQWSQRMWREPDISDIDEDGGSAIWYGPDGEDGDDATLVEGESGRGYNDDVIRVTEYHNPAGEIDEPEGNFLTHSTSFSRDSILEELALLGITPRDEHELYRWAAGIGVAHLAYYGGDEDWTDRLPRITTQAANDDTAGYDIDLNGLARASHEQRRR